VIASGYSMDLYCRNVMATAKNQPKTAHHIWIDGKQFRGTGEATFLGETFKDCKKQAQEAGWVFGRDGDVTCPQCAKKDAK